MNYTVSESASWFDVTPTGGSSSGEADSITINYVNGVISGLLPGVYLEAITVTGKPANAPRR